MSQIIRVAVLVVLAVVAAPSQTVMRTHPVASWGTGLADLNGDGIPEYARIAAAIEVFCGRTGILLHNLWLPSQPVWPGSGSSASSVARIGDLDGDGVDDLMAGASAEARVYSGVSGALIHAWVVISQPGGPGTSFGNVVGDAGDVDMDGVDDVFVSDPLRTVVTLYSGANGFIIRNIWHPLNPSAAFGTLVENLGDIDGDQVPDLGIGGLTTPGVFTIPAVSSAYVISGATGQLLQILTLPSGLFAPSLQSLASLGDVNGDGVPDHATAPGTSGLANVDLRVVSGLTTFPIWSIDAATLPVSSGAVMAMPDANGDGIMDVGFVGAAFPIPNTISVFSGTDGTLIQTSVPGTGLIAPWVDVNGDGSPEFIAAVGVISLNTLPTALWSPHIVTGGPLPAILNADVPVLGDFWSLALTGAPTSASGFLVVAPGPSNPIPLAPGLVVYPDLFASHLWQLVPIVTDGAGEFAFTEFLPFSNQLEGLELVMQAWIPGAGGLASSTLSSGFSMIFGY